MGKNRDKDFTRLKKNHPLVDRLISEVWWHEIVRLSHVDPDINIQLRSDSINVYSKMGNLLRISLHGNKVFCQIHYKYLIAEEKSPYVPIISSDGQRLVVSGNVCPNIQDIFDTKNFKTIKQNIAIYAGEEKAIQSRLVEKNKETIVDVEVAFSGKSGPIDAEEDNARIDFVNFDKNLRKLVFVELKQAFDARLYSKEINDQIKKYYEFALKNGSQIIKAYNDAINTKKKLGIIRDASFLADVKIEAIEPRPILVVAGFNQNVIDGLSNNISCNLNKFSTTKYLSGLYFFGKDVDLNIQKRKQKNKEIFL
ncbi:MAG: hypothetical protein NT178_07585 [Proteobacteria bacterium]|nr:hypothetical protein [Pseudomonadota bacterium]